MSAKKAEMVSAGIPDPSPSAIQKAISKDEMARHCKRRTRGVKQTTEAIEALLLSFSMATDTLGVPLLKEEIKSIWEEQQKHVACIQDPPGVQLYTVTGHILKGGVMLPVLRCARGSTSLESFHLHLARFVPGTSAGAVNFQAYLLDGITRWNAARSASALQVNKDETLHTFNTRLQCKIQTKSLLYTMYVFLNTFTMHCVTHRSINSVNLFLERQCFPTTGHRRLLESYLVFVIFTTKQEEALLP